MTERYRIECVIFAGVFLSRILFLFIFAFLVPSLQNTTSPIPVFGSDSHDYLFAAQQLIETGAFLDSIGRQNSFELPGYPLFLAILITLFKTIWVVPIVQALLVSISAILIYRIGIIISPFVGLMSALLFAFDPAGIYYPQTILAEPLFILLLLSSTYVITRYSFLKKRHAMGAGLLLGLATMVRPVGEVFLPAGVFYCILVKNKNWKQPITTSLLFIVGFFIIVTPWMIRNKLIFDSLELTVNPSMQFYLAHAPYFYAYKNSITPREAQHIFEERLLTIDPYPEEIKAGKAGTLRHASYMRRVAFDYIKQDIWGYILFHSVKTTPLFLSDGFRDIAERLDFLPVGGSSIGGLLLKIDIAGLKRTLMQNPLTGMLFFIGSSFWFLITLFMVIGSVSGIFYEKDRSRAILFFALLIVLASAIVAGGVVASPRYRYSTSPFIFLLASYGFYVARDFFRQKIRIVP